MKRVQLLSRSLVYRAVLALAASAALPAAAGIVSLGDFNPNPGSGLVAGTLSIGITGLGSVAVDSGSTLQADRITLGNTSAGQGSLTLSGTGTTVQALMPSAQATSTNNLNIGSLGTGSVSVLGGASFIVGATGDANCLLNCRIRVSNGAGSNGSLMVSGSGSSASTPGGVIVGSAAVLILAVDGIDYGAPGGISQGRVDVLAGGSATSTFMTIGNAPTGGGVTGAERSNGAVLVDGIGSVWNLVRNAAQAGAQALLGMAPAANSSATLDVRNGAVVRLDGSVSRNQLSGMNLGSGVGISGANSVSTARIDGGGSRIEFNGGTGFLNIGRGQGATADMHITNGGVVTGSGANGSGLPFMSVGRNGGTGTLEIDGSNSLLRLNGTDPSNAAGTGGAFMQVGRFESGLAGNGSINISNGGRLAIDTLGHLLANANAQTGMNVGVGVGSSGAINVSGANSRLDIMADSGLTPYIGIGRDGANGSMMISGGGMVEVSSSHISVPNPGTYLPGGVMLFEIGRRVGNADSVNSVGVVTIAGAGSELALTGTSDNLLVIGRGNNATGTLNINNGGQARAMSVLIGTEANATGTLNMNAGTLLVSGVVNGGPGGFAGTGNGIGVGRADGVGTANIGNGSVVTITSTAPQSSLSIGGTATAPGGTGFVNVSGGSSVSVSGPDAFVAVGRTASATAAGIGTLSITGAGSSVSATGSNAHVRIGAGANTIGTVVVGAGSSLSATSLIGMAHDGLANTGGTGALIVNGTATAASLIVGSGGALGGSGVINANVTNLGTINPGNPRGRLTINGAFDNSAGRIVLEVQQLAGGLFAYDELVLGDVSRANLGAGAVEFVFLGATNPLDFLNANLFDLATFFKETNVNGDIVDLSPVNRSLFGGSLFSASAQAYTISNFVFSPTSGASLNAVPVPAPQTLALALLGLVLLGAIGRRGSRG